MSTDAARRDRVTNVILMILLLAAAVEIVLLIRQNRTLRARIDSFSTTADAGPVTGDHAEALDVTDLQGAPVRLEFPREGSRSLVLVLSAECPACTQTLPVWKQVIDGAAGGDVRPVALSLQDPGPVSEKLREAGMPIDVYKVGNGAGAEKWRLKFVPITVLVDASGIVSKVWPGVPSKDAQEEMSQLVRKTS
jgi:hypothetical protein